MIVLADVAATRLSSAIGVPAKHALLGTSYGRMTNKHLEPDRMTTAVHCPLPYEQAEMRDTGEHRQYSRRRDRERRPRSLLEDCRRTCYPNSERLIELMEEQLKCLAGPTADRIARSAAGQSTAGLETRSILFMKNQS